MIQRFCSAALFLALLVPMAGCAAFKTKNQVKLSEIYDRQAQLPDHLRNPVIVIPGILGSKLVDKNTGKVAWGEIGLSTSSPLRTSTLTAVSIPMRYGVRLSQLRDNTHEDGPLDQLTFKVLGFPIRVNAYAHILAALGVGGYRDQHLDINESNQVDYGDEHFTCFQFSYDWRRDISETAAQLHNFIEQKEAYTRQKYLEKYGIENANIQFDIVAHSMGGLVSRYYLRYGNQPLPEDGSLPELNWAGANRVQRALIIGTPNAGSALSIKELKHGVQLARALPRFPAAVVGTMPAAYQLLPRNRDNPWKTASGRSLDVYDPNVWKKLGWGLADPKQDRTLKKLLPHCDKDTRRRIALEHQAKCLARARQFNNSIDTFAVPPSTLQLHLFAGDAMHTLDKLVVDLDNGKIVQEIMAPGDGTVTRTSAVSEEQLGDETNPRVMWNSRTFLSADHLGLTRDRAFVDNALSRLLERKPASSYQSTPILIPQSPVVIPEPPLTIQEPTGDIGSHWEMFLQNAQSGAANSDGTLQEVFAEPVNVAPGGK